MRPGQLRPGVRPPRELAWTAPFSRWSEKSENRATPYAPEPRFLPFYTVTPWNTPKQASTSLWIVSQGLAGRFIEDLPGSDPTRNLALTALRHFFDALVMRHAVALNPFASVRGRQHAVVDGKTPELTIQQARALLGSLDLSNVVGLRDRAVLGVLTYTGARVGALARLRRGDLQNQETQRVLRFAEKAVLTVTGNAVTGRPKKDGVCGPTLYRSPCGTTLGPFLYPYP